jgi:hypothetical protein
MMTNRTDLLMDAKARGLFRKLIGKLGSDQEGERASAANLCTRLLLRHRLTWADVVAGKLEDGQDTDRTFEQGYLRGYEDGFQRGVKSAQTAAEQATQRQKAVRRELTEEETAMLTWLTKALLHCPKDFSAFEKDFIRNVIGQNMRLGGLSEKQITCLSNIYHLHVPHTTDA